MKTCAKCSTTKPLADFYRDRAKKDGYRNECKDCTKAKLAQYYEANRDREKARGKYNRDKAAGKAVTDTIRVEFDGTLRRRRALWRFARKHALRIDLGKHCTKCGEWKLRIRFTRGCQTKDGRRSACATCSAKEATAHYWADPEGHRAAALARVAANYETIRARRKELRDANPDPYRASSLAYYYAHSEQQRAKNAAWHQRNRAYRKRYAREHYPLAKAHNPERFRNAGRKRRATQRNAPGVLTTEKVGQRISLYGNRCYLCGQGATAMDHVKPLSMGGSNWPSNLRPICGSCNSRKHNTWPFPIPAGRFPAAREVVA